MARAFLSNSAKNTVDSVISVYSGSPGNAGASTSRCQMVHWVRFIYKDDIPININRFTELKDKAGKEIYEGDVCQDGDTIIQILWADNHQWGCLILKGGALTTRLTFPLWQWDRYEMNGYRQLKVIGNIYENPDLLKMA